jgi:formylglycine-generating enzyme
MRRRAWLRGGLFISAAASGVGACTQLIGVEPIPTASPPSDASVLPDRSADHSNGPDAAKRCDAESDGACVVPCAKGATECASDGVSMRTCNAQGVWGAVVACGGTKPVCADNNCRCDPHTTQCATQSWQTCRAAVDGGPPVWVSEGDACAGTCTLTGCGAPPPSCANAAPDASGVAGCLDDANGESCCTSNEVQGGQFHRSYDGFSSGFASPLTSTEATVSGFRLDRYEVTVGRFRQFVAALTGGSLDAGGAPPWLPQAGSGKHTHLNGGQGLASSQAGGGFERGWDPRWNGQLAAATVKSHITCGGPALSTWSLGDDSNPINCVGWAAAYAFCIWDGGFLPSEAEWNYAAAGGSEQRIYPWSVPLARETEKGLVQIDCQHANYLRAGGPCANNTAEPVGTDSLGDGKWGQADMGGNLLEWTLDVYSQYTKPCVDCAALGAPDTGADAGTVLRMQRGGAFVSHPSELTTSFRGYNPEQTGSSIAGFRCARTP